MDALLTFINVTLTSVVGEKCALNFMDAYMYDDYCNKLLLSKILSYGIILGSFLVKFPQIYKIFANSSGEGISMAGQLFELLSFSGTVSYSLYMSYPLNTYGEAINLMGQTSLIIFASFYFNEATRIYAFLFFAAYATLLAYLLSPFISPLLVYQLQNLNIPIVASGKMLQIFSNYSNRSTGQLSALTVFLIGAGSIARIFTSIQETGDFSIILSFTISSLFNIILMFQILYYWNSKDRSKKE